MTIATQAELSLLRSRPHSTKLWLSIYQPRIALACRVNDAGIAKGEMSVTYDGVATGSYSLIESGMMALVGTTNGGDEKGRVRIRSATSSVLSVAENSHINWEDDDYITVPRAFEIVAIFPRITAPDSEGNTTWYKDYDVAYTNQNDILGSFVCMGSHFAGFLGGTGTCQVYYTASGTHNMLGSSLSYHWFFEGATLTGSNSHTPGYIAYTSPGHFTTRLIVSGSAGEVDKSYRHISIYNRPGQGSNVPILKWEMNSLSGDRENGGYTATLRIFEDVPHGIIRDGALVVIFADDVYNNTVQSIGGNATNRSSIVFAGYIINGSIKYNYASSVVEFEIGSSTEIMKSVQGFSVAANSSSNPASEATTNENIPSGWVLVKNMDVRRGLYHYLRWHSTALLCNDFEFRGTDKNVQYMDTDRQSLYDAIHSWVNGTLYGEVVADRQGKVWAEVSVAATDLASGSFPTAIRLEKIDWMNTPEIVEKMYAPLAFLEMGGFGYSGATTGTSTPYLSQAPGETPAYEGDLEQIEGMVINSQSDLNILCGNVFAYKNARYPSVLFELSGNYRNLDIAPQELVSVTIAESYTERGIIWDEKPFTLRGIVTEYDSRKETFLPTIDLYEVTQGFPADTIIIPEEAPDDYDDEGDVIDPPLPPLPPVIDPPTVSDAHPAIAYMLGWKYIGGGNGLTDTTATNYKQIIAKSTNFNTASPTWTDFLSSATGQPPSGTFIQYLPMSNNPAQGGYWLTTLGVWWISGLNLSDPASVVSVNILTAADAKTLCGSSYDILFGCMYQDYTTAQNLYVGAHDIQLIPTSFVFKSARALGNTWNAYTIAASTKFPRDPSQPRQASIAVGYSNPLSVYAALSGAGTHGKIYRSVNGGISWSQVYSDGSGAGGMPLIHIPLYIPYNDNNIWIMSTNNFNNKYIKVGSADFSGVIDRTISYGGNSYGSASTSIYKETELVSCKYSPLNMAVLAYWGLNDVIQAVDEPPTLFTSADGGATWTFRKTFVSYSAIHPRCQALVIHPNNPAYLYMVGNRTEGHILVSSDYGVTFADKTGDWFSKFATVPTRGAELATSGYAQNSGYIYPIF